MRDTVSKSNVDGTQGTAHKVKLSLHTHMHRHLSVCSVNLHTLVHAHVPTCTHIQSRNKLKVLKTFKICQRSWSHKELECWGVPCKQIGTRQAHFKSQLLSFCM